jgi:hypothetical protein
MLRCFSFEFCEVVGEQVVDWMYVDMHDNPKHLDINKKCKLTHERGCTYLVTLLIYNKFLIYNNKVSRYKHFVFT